MIFILAKSKKEYRDKFVVFTGNGGFAIEVKHQTTSKMVQNQDKSTHFRGSEETGA